ncbi:MAG: ATP-binding protein [Anaerolineales bacterium]|nr:ATP-binding protein [Anaerolineales bacterium]
METEILRELLTQPETATLEFKRELYKLDGVKAETKKRQKDELIKDILSLANGSPLTVGDKAYLIIGADDELQPDGNRELFDVDPNSLTKKRILQIVNTACHPSLQDIECESVEFEGNRLLVITIWPTPHLHETTRDLVTSKSSFSKHTVFTRHDENIDVASQREREAILKLKQIHTADTRNAPPIRFGAVVGAAAGAFTIGGTLYKKGSTRPSSEETIRTLTLGAIVGALPGMYAGWIYNGVVEARYNWHFLTHRNRIITLGMGIIGMLIMHPVIRLIERILSSRHRN